MREMSVATRVENLVSLVASMYNLYGVMFC